MASIYFNKALLEDISGNYKKAIELYTQSIEEEELILDSYLNLAGILIEISFDHGISSSLIRGGSYTQEELDQLFESLGRLLNHAAIQFDSNEVRFWKYYMENFYYGLNRNEITKFTGSKEASLIPVFQLYIDDLSTTKSSMYANEIRELKKLLIRDKTIKNKYILSLIEAAGSCITLSGAVSYTA